MVANAVVRFGNSQCSSVSEPKIGFSYVIAPFPLHLLFIMGSSSFYRDSIVENLLEFKSNKFCRPIQHVHVSHFTAILSNFLFFLVTKRIPGCRKSARPSSGLHSTSLHCRHLLPQKVPFIQLLLFVIVGPVCKAAFTNPAEAFDFLDCLILL